MGDASGGLGDGDSGESYLGGQFRDECAADEFHHVLCGGIPVGESFSGIQIRIAKWSHDSIHQGFQSMKITQQAILIEDGALDEHREVPIMAMNLLTFPRKHEGVGGGEGCLD